MDSNSPSPEVLKPQDDADSQSQAPDNSEASGASSDDKNKPHLQVKPRRGSHRPSHKATLIGIVVVVGVLAVNVGVIGFFLTRQSDDDGVNRDEVTISSDALGQLGVTRTPVGNLGTELIVGPDSRFNGKVTVGGDLDVAGQLTLNSGFSASEADISDLQAGKTSLSELNVNGDATISNLNLRQDLNVAGVTQLQGAVTVNNNLTVAGNITAGGSLFVKNFQVSTLTVGGHLISRGAPPSVSKGGAIGSNGTVSVSGNDASGTVAVNAGTGAGGGTLATVSFRNQYSNTPHVVITPIGKSAPNVYVTRSASSFSIGVSGGLSAGGYAFDYIVVQ